jgi:integration host factor subunit beta
MSTVTKQDLANRISENTHFKLETVKTIVQLLLDQITMELARDNRLELRDFGVFEPHTRQARNAKNPRTLESIHVPAKRAVRFKMGRLMRERMNEDLKECRCDPPI